MLGKVAVLGSADFVMPFSALGADCFASETPEEVTENANSIIDGKYALVVVAENIALQAGEVFEPHAKEAIPAVVVVPFTTESKGFATRSLGNALRIATGIDILQNN